MYSSNSRSICLISTPFKTFHSTEYFTLSKRLSLYCIVYNNLPKFLKEIDDYTAFKKVLKLFLLLQPFYSVEEFVSS